MSNELARLLETLGRDAAERFSLNHKRPDGQFRSRVVTVGRVAGLAMPTDRDVWYGTAPLHERVTSGRGAARDVVGLRELAADLDVKPGGMPSWEAAWSVVHELAAMLGSEPVAVVESGHGLQPHWAIERGPDTDWPDDQDPRWLQAVALLRRWGRLVASVAERYEGRADAVFDLSRVLRAPGTLNHKASPARQVELKMLGGGPVSLDRLGDALDEWGVSERPEDLEIPGAVVAPAEGWQYGTVTCGYARQMVQGWRADRPEARHPWLVSQATRLAAAYRLGCVTEQDYGRARGELAGLFVALLQAGQPREAGPGEVAGALSWGVATVAAMAEQRVRAELGDHPHQAAQDLSFDPDEAAPESHTAVDPAIGHPEPDELEPGSQPAEQTDVDEVQGLGGHLRLAELFARDFGRHLRYVHKIGWHVWPTDGMAWREDADGMPVRAVHVLLRREIERGAKLATDPAMAEQGEAVMKRARSACSAAAVKGVLELAGSLTPITVAPEGLDADPYLFATPAGTLDLREGRIRPPRREDLISKLAGGGPEPGDDPGPLRAFLERVQPDPEVRGFLQRLLGQALHGEVREHVLPIWHGTGANGKSTLMELMFAFFGSYAAAIRADTLLQHAHTQHPTGIMSLRGARLAFTHETDQGRRFSASLVKQLTGGDRITARRMRQDEITWLPTHTLVMVTNHAPEVDPEDEAMWRRLLVVPWDVIIPEEERDLDLGRKLQAHLGAVGRWLLEGWQEYVSRGLAIPEAVRTRTAEYRNEADALGQFLAEQARPNAVASVGSGDLFNRWSSWCRTRGEEPGGIIAFAKTMEARGFKKIKSHGSVRWQKLTLRDELDPEG